MAEKSLLEFTGPGGDVTTHELSEESPATIGRSSGNTYVLKEGAISRRHAVVEFREGRFWLEDLGSSNGTRLRGETVTAPVSLRTGDVIQIGSFHIRLRAGPAPDTARFTDASGPSTLGSIDVGAIFSSGARPVQEGKTPESGLLRRMDRIGQALLTHRKLDELYRYVVDLVGEVIGPDRCAILLGEEADDDLETMAVYRADTSKKQEIIISRSIARQAIKDRRAILVEDAQTDARFKEMKSVILKHIHTAMCAPLWDDHRVIGLLYADNPSAGKVLSEDDLHLFSLIGHLTAVKIRETQVMEELQRRQQIEEELKRAAEIQSDFLPTEVLHAGEFVVAGRSLPCLGVGGDYFDYMESSDGRIFLALGDVSGKGMSAALLMATLHANVRAFLETGSDLRDVVLRLNGFIHTRTRGCRFATLFLCSIDKTTGRVLYVNAGHDQPFLVHPGGSLERLHVGGLMVGAFPEAAYEVGETLMEQGSLLLAYSDGVTEAGNRDGEFFEERRVEEQVAAGSALEPEEMIDRLVCAVKEHAGSDRYEDDVTIVAVRRSG